VPESQTDLTERIPADEYVEFRHAGQLARGEFECVGCGYGVVVRRTLPPCPMCDEKLWERRLLRELGSADVADILDPRD
jgi:rubrerythrin